MATKNRVSSPQKGNGEAWKIVLGVILFFVFCFVIKAQWNAWFPEKDNGKENKERVSKTEVVSKQKHTETLLLKENDWKVYRIIPNWKSVHFDIPETDIYIKRRLRNGTWEQAVLMRKGSTTLPLESRNDISHFAFKTVKGTSQIDVWQWNY